jgi:hypothetical protein
MQEGDVERVGVWWVLLVKDDSNLGSYNLRATITNGFVVRTQNLGLRECFGG